MPPLPSLQDDLIDLLVCPACRGSLRRMYAPPTAPAPAPGLGDVAKVHELTELNELAGLACDTCAVVYPVEMNIPVLMTDAATPLKATPAPDC